MPKAYPRELREEALLAARDRAEGVTLLDVANPFGIHPMTLRKWVSMSATGATTPQGTGTTLADAQRRIRLLERENQVLREAAAYLAQANIPTRNLGQGARTAVTG